MTSEPIENSRSTAAEIASKQLDEQISGEASMPLVFVFHCLSNYFRPCLSVSDSDTIEICKQKSVLHLAHHFWQIDDYRTFTTNFTLVHVGAEVHSSDAS